jgi:putative hydrolase
MAMTDVKFILTSDAHTPNRIGDFAAGLTLAVNAGLDVERIVNIEMS